MHDLQLTQCCFECTVCRPFYMFTLHFHAIDSATHFHCSSSGAVVGTRPATQASCGENFLDRAIVRAAPSDLFSIRPIASFLFAPEMSEKSGGPPNLLYVEARFKYPQIVFGCISYLLESEYQHKKISPNVAFCILS